MEGALRTTLEPLLVACGPTGEAGSAQQLIECPDQRAKRRSVTAGERGVRCEDETVVHVTERGVVRMERHEVSDVLGDDGLFTHLRTSEQLWVGKRDEAVVFFDCLDVVPSLPELLGENRREHLVQE